MIETLLEAILEQIDQPKKDLEHNLRALLNEAVSRMDLVSQDEIQRQKNALFIANQRLAILDEKIKQLESSVQAQK
ncbi:accessory factor UbiK family protein [Acinetobacter sp. ANC 4641]|uniref:accessory factor UbiK family protein n=1 Tax=Acinetobacter sp. ANC 4641 TaxID=2529847 RepID=UPI00103F6050|nr:accessory factor UbiK family protein [Acinetobacter sp. ANC 4641]TCB13152.1 accessory factor UbiK family protein [Acinetobacter sp. ANC 4641]